MDGNSRSFSVAPLNKRQKEGLLRLPLTHYQ